MQCDVCFSHPVAVCTMLAEEILLRGHSEVGVVYKQAQIRIAGGASLADLGVAKQVFGLTGMLCACSANIPAVSYISLVYMVNILRG